MDSEGEKKSKTTPVGLQKCQQKLISKKMVEISKNLKNCIVSLEFQCPKLSQIILKFINLGLLNEEFHKFE